VNLTGATIERADVKSVFWQDSICPNGEKVKAGIGTGGLALLTREFFAAASLPA